MRGARRSPRTASATSRTGPPGSPRSAPSDAAAPSPRATRCGKTSCWIAGCMPRIIAPPGDDGDRPARREARPARLLHWCDVAHPRLRPARHVARGPLQRRACVPWPPPPARPVPYRVRAIADGETVLDTERAALLHEHGHLPVFYAPLEDFRADLLEPSGTSTHCPFKGDASYLHLRLPGRRLDDAIWRYAEPIASAAWLAPLAALRFDAADRWLCEDADVIGHPRDLYHRIDGLADVAPGLDLAPRRRPRRNLARAHALRDRPAAAPLHSRRGRPRGPARAERDRHDLRLQGPRELPLRARRRLRGGRPALDVRGPGTEVGAIRGHWCFFDEDVDADGVRQARPRTPWSPPETG